jgi:hypothetical protein
MPKYTVYCTTNLITHEIYIGVHKTLNPNDEYLGSGVRLNSAIKKYGKHNFKKDVLYIFDKAEAAYLKEKELVNEDFVSQSNTYNLKIGGKGGWDHFTDYQSRNEKIAQNRDYSSKDLRNKLSKAATKHNLQRGSLCFGGKRDGFKNKTHSEKARKNISNKLKGKVSSTKGRMWVHNLIQKKAIMIYPNELSTYLELGWIKGNKRNFG